MLSISNAGIRQDDIDHRLQSAARAFHVNKWMDSLRQNDFNGISSKFFDAMITPVVYFAVGQRKIQTNCVDVHCRKLLRRAVGPAPGIEWSQPWHTLLNALHNRIDQQLTDENWSP